jgi:hypothetical protein
LIKEWEEVNQQLDQIEMTIQIVKRVLGDAFHFMDLIKVPTHHKYTSTYFRALRSDFFICDEHDLDLVKAVARGNGQRWEHVMAFYFKYVALRVKRVIPMPSISYLIERVTKKPLFNENAKEMTELVLEGILRGEISDPPGVSFYCHKTNDDGTAEALHRAMISSMGHTKSDPRYSDNLLTFVRHI